MNDEALGRFRTFLSRRGSAAPDREILLHEMGATINRHRLTGRDEGIHAFNTNQLCGLIISQASWSRDQPFVTGLMLSALIDGEYDIFTTAKNEGLLPADWAWVSWADGFSGDEADLRKRLQSIAPIRERCGAVSLATRANPKAIGARLLGDFRSVPLATVYHQLLRAALTSAQAPTIAVSELTSLAEHLEVLFAADTDATLASLVRASTLDHPDIMTKPFKDAAGDLTRAALAQRHLERGRAQEALTLIKDTRFLSPAYNQAILIAALAALECGKFESAEFYCRSIADDDTRLKIVTRIAQAAGDVSTEVDALSRLYERNPQDAQVFVMLINVLMRIGQGALAKALCAEAQERFLDDPIVERFIRPILTGVASNG
jgi:hypothetical protein